MTAISKAAEIAQASAASTKIDLRTDVGNAFRLAYRHGQDIRFVAGLDGWITCNDQTLCWTFDTDGAVMRLAEETILAMLDEVSILNDGASRAELLRHALKSQSKQRLDAMVNLAKAEPGVTISAASLDADPWLLGVANGVIELKTQTFQPARREDLITKCAGPAYDPAATCPEWMRFLRTVTNGDSDLMDYLQRLVGYCLTGSVREEVMFVFYGTGRNGKSTFREIVHALMGSYALVADATLLIQRKVPGGATEEVARLMGRRFVAVNETAENDQLDEARVKFVTSQDMITARNLYGHYFDFFPTHKTILTTNHRPVIRGTDDGIWRRVQMVPFTVSIAPTAVETDLRERRLMPELSGILNWALAGLSVYLRQGLDPPKAVLQSTQEYRSEMDVVGQWIDQCCQLDPKAEISIGAAYVNYEQWADEEVGWNISKIKFRRHLSDRGFEAKKGTGGKRLICGLKLKPVSPAAEGPADVGQPEADVESAVAEVVAEASDPPTN